MGFINSLLGGKAKIKSSNPVTQQMSAEQIKQSQAALGQQQMFVNALNAQNGLGNQTDVYNQLQDVANGQGPNPAQAMLNQATGQNAQQTAALMGSQRGIQSNPGLLARLAANQGAQLQQQAVGQGATMAANQQLGAISAAGNMANQQAAQQQQGIANLNQFNQGQQGQLLNANQQSDQVQAGLAAGNAQRASSIGGGILGGIGKAIGFADGGEVPPMPAQPSSIDAFFSSTPPNNMAMKSGGYIPGQAKTQGDSIKNDVVPILASPGEIMIPRSVVNSKNPGQQAAAFVEAILARNGKSLKK